MVFAEKVKAVTGSILGDRNSQPLQLPRIRHLSNPRVPISHSQSRHTPGLHFKMQCSSGWEVLPLIENTQEQKNDEDLTRIEDLMRISLIIRLCLAPTPCQDLQERAGKGFGRHQWNSCLWGGPVPPTPEFTFGCSQGSCPAWLKAGDVLNLSLGEQAAKFVPGAGVREAFPARVSEGSMETRT